MKHLERFLKHQKVLDLWEQHREAREAQSRAGQPTIDLHPELREAMIHYLDDLQVTGLQQSTSVRKPLDLGSEDEPLARSLAIEDLPERRASSFLSGRHPQAVPYSSSVSSVLFLVHIRRFGI